MQEPNLIFGTDFKYTDDPVSQLQDAQGLGQLGSPVELSGHNVSDSDDYYELTLSIHYETCFGEYLCVTGDIPELGSWNNYKCRL